MDEFTKMVLFDYHEYLKDKYMNEILTYQELMNPDSETIDWIASYIPSVVVNFAKETADESTIKHFEEIGHVPSNEEKKEYYNYVYEQNCYAAHINIISSALIYILSFPTKKGEEFLNLIISSNILDIVNDLYDEDSSLMLTLAEFYGKYLAARGECFISLNQEEDIIRKYRFLRNLTKNKGYETLGDIAREILVNMHRDFMDIYDFNDKIYKMIDGMFASNLRDNYLKENGIDITNKEAVRIIKQMMIRVILADAYIDLINLRIELETSNNEEPLSSYEIDAIEFIESLEDDEVFLPDDFNTRKALYFHFFYSNEQIYTEKDADYDALDEQQKVLVSKINPLCSLD